MSRTSTRLLQVFTFVVVDAFSLYILGVVGKISAMLFVMAAGNVLFVAGVAAEVLRKGRRS